MLRSRQEMGVPDANFNIEEDVQKRGNVDWFLRKWVGANLIGPLGTLAAYNPGGQHLVAGRVDS